MRVRGGMSRVERSVIGSLSGQFQSRRFRLEGAVLGVRRLACAFSARWLAAARQTSFGSG